MTRRILVFPCGSEIGLEIHRSMRFSTHFELIGASSVEDHGCFVFEHYVGNVPFHDSPAFASAIAKVVQAYKIDAIYPTMDGVADTLQGLAATLGVRIIGSSPETTALCSSKQATYDHLHASIPVPAKYDSLDAVPHYPVFIKPDRGYGSRYAQRADTPAAASAALACPEGGVKLLLEYLPGCEWTVDCFSDRHGALRFHAARGRNRVSHGISVNTAPDDRFATEFARWAQLIHDILRPRGAWFFQARADASGQPKLLEVAARLGGSSGLFRCLGVNFALLSAFDAFDMDVDIAPNRYAIELDRALDNRYRLDIDYARIYVDLDDCLIVRGTLNHQLVGFLFKASAAGKQLSLVTRHAGDPLATLANFRLQTLFDEITHITDGSPKAPHVRPERAIFIDDSHSERTAVARIHRIPVFAPDMIEALL